MDLKQNYHVCKHHDDHDVDVIHVIVKHYVKVKLEANGQHYLRVPNASDRGFCHLKTFPTTSESGNCYTGSFGL